MKKNTSFRNLMDILLTVFFVAWMFFGMIILGNKFDIFKYSGFSGRMIALVGELVPVTVTYVFLVVWKDIKTPKEYFSKILECKSWGRTLTALAVFVVIHLIFALICGVRTTYRPLYLIFGIPVALLSYGLAEVLWRGIVFQMLWQHQKYIQACLVTGLLNALFFVPVWSVDGVAEGMYAVPSYFLYSLFLGIVLGALYCITESVTACIIFQTFAQILTFFFGSLRFGNPLSAVFCIAEMVLSLVAVLIFRISRPGRGWSAPEGDEYM